MRYAPVAFALSLVLAISTSVGSAQERVPNPRAAMLIAEGNAALQAGKPQQAIDSFEAALAVDPGYTGTFVQLGEVARREGLQGKAIRYYREALRREPGNISAIAGEGQALVEKGAVERARRNLAVLESVCGANCPEARKLASVISAGPQPKMLAAESVMQEGQVTKN